MGSRACAPPPPESLCIVSYSYGLRVSRASLIPKRNQRRNHMRFAVLLLAPVDSSREREKL